MSSKIKPLESLTNLEAERQSKINAGQELEEIEAMGQDSERKAAKAVIELHKEDEKKEYNKEQERKEELFKKRHLPRFDTYKQHLVTQLGRMLEEEELPEEFYWQVKVTNKGFEMTIWKGDGSFYRRRASYICGDVAYDFNAIERFAFWAGDEVHAYAESQKDKKTPGGIILPS